MTSKGPSTDLWGTMNRSERGSDDTPSRKTG
jgi:hypothetical protein